MGKVKYFIGKIPLRVSFILYVASFVIIAFLGTRATFEWANDKMWYILHDYWSDVQHYPDDDIGVITVTLIPENHPHSSEYQKYRIIRDTAPLFWYTPCIILSALLFYRQKLKKPLYTLNKAMTKIAAGELDFSISNNSNDEMGRLCNSFEKMRASLDESVREMLHMADERKRLNDAYTHDLRTPITVLKGYADMILQSGVELQMSHDEVLSAIKTMSAHIS